MLPMLQVLTSMWEVFRRNALGAAAFGVYGERLEIPMNLQHCFRGCQAAKSVRPQGIMY